MSPADEILMYETGHFAALWAAMARRLGLKPELLTSDWRTGVDPNALEARLRHDPTNSIKAVCVVHNETSTGCTSRIDEIRAAIDAAAHPALLIVDTISSLGSIDYRHDEWRVDVSVGASQKGLMLPPGLSFNAVSEKAFRAAETSGLPKSYWSWDDMKRPNTQGFFPYTPATNLLFGLDTALQLLNAEGLDKVFARHDRHAEATRLAVKGWGLELLCANPKHFSASVTAVVMPNGHSADRFRGIALSDYDLSLGSGLSRVADKVFRIGHLGSLNDLMLAGTLAGVEMSLARAAVPHKARGVQCAIDYLKGVPNRSNGCSALHSSLA